MHIRHEDVTRDDCKWLPEDHCLHKEWLGGVIQQVKKNPTDLHPVLKEFKTLLETNARIFMLVQTMFEQIPNKEPYISNPIEHKHIQGYERMLQVLNHILTTVPQWNSGTNRMVLVGASIYSVFNWPMGTPSGAAFFLDPEVNAALKKMLDAWGAFLRSKISAELALTTGPHGWLCASSKAAIAAAANDAAGTELTFEELFECNPALPQHGFASWDAFFTRPFREGMRSIAAPDDDAVIANACESRPYNIARGVALRDTFWVKGRHYSVIDMLGSDEHAPLFAGGTIYQAFLSVLCYHRWHAPVSGRVVRAFVKPGTYYSELPLGGMGDSANGKDEGGGGVDTGDATSSQVYLTAVATRAIILIEADNPKIGLMAFIAVGMMEVSTCDIGVREGQHITKGEEIGMFHFGGSSHCVLFRKGVDVQEFPEPGREENVPVRGRLAVVKG